METPELPHQPWQLASCSASQLDVTHMAEKDHFLWVSLVTSLSLLLSKRY